MFNELVGGEGDDGKPSKTLEATLNGLATKLTEDKGEVKNGDLKASKLGLGATRKCVVNFIHAGAPPGTPLARLSSDPASLENISSPSTKITLWCRFEELTEFFWFVNGNLYASYSYTDGDVCPCPPTMKKSPPDFNIVIDQAYRLDKLKGLSTLTVTAANLEGVQNIACGSLEIRSAPVSMNFSFSCKQLTSLLSSLYLASAQHKPSV
jgi:hypothetical protein